LTKFIKYLMVAWVPLDDNIQATGTPDIWSSRDTREL
jgi:hypothetical protein